MNKFTTVRAVLAATAFCGTLDILFAFGMAGLRGTGPHRVLQYIASGLFGTVAFQQGMRTAGLGLVLHYAIMLAICAFFIVTFRKVTLLGQYWPASGLLYGLIVYGVMSHIVIPLSAIGSQPFRWPGDVFQMAAMICLVGLPTAWFAQRATA